MAMQTSQERHYKERKPQETAEYLQGILRQLGIPVEEQRIPKSSIDTYSMRVRLTGTDIGSNGKGVSEDYMKASAYAEFFERLQNGHFNPWGWCKAQPEGFWHCPDERMLSSEELAAAAQEQSFLHYYFSYRGLMDLSVRERAEAFAKLHKVEFQFGRGVDAYEARPFYSVRNDRVEYVPYYLSLMHYASNGMCAGNTPYEAFVQGFSEIIERHVQKKIFLEKPCLPDVPDDYIRRFPEIWEKIQKLRQIPGIRACMKDGSFGGRFPVAVLVLISQNTGGYGVKLGCHPDFGIAMERTLTEATQGGDLQEYCARSWIDFYDHRVDTQANIYNSYKFGQAQYPSALFGEEHTYPFVPARDVSMQSNRQLFEGLLAGFLAAGYDILIRDVSYLGFPSYQILIPGFSELQEETDLMAKIYNTRAHLGPYLAYPARLDNKKLSLLLGVLGYWADSPMENQMKMLYSSYPDADFPAEDLRMGWLYLSAMCHVRLGDYKTAAEEVLQILSVARRVGNPQENFYRALYEYLTLRDTGKDHCGAMCYLKKFFEEAYLCRLEALLEDEEQILIKQYPRYDYLGLYGEVPKGECAVWAKVRDVILERYRETCPDQRALRTFFTTGHYEGDEERPK